MRLFHAYSDDTIFMNYYFKINPSLRNGYAEGGLCKRVEEPCPFDSTHVGRINRFYIESANDLTYKVSIYW